jgi:hypothetical protein
MAQDPLVTIGKVATLDKLAILERNIRSGGAATPEIGAAIERKYAEFGQQLVAEKTGLDLSELTPAETKIVNAVGRYVGLQKRDGKGTARTFQLLANRGLIDAAEVTVARSKVTQGFEVLDRADLRALSFEQIIVDHPEEFSARALWHARRTLGLPNESGTAPADRGTLTQQRTETVLTWLVERAARNGGRLFGYTNADIGRQLGFEDLARHGRVLGNIQSRIDFACYVAGAPPLGLCAVEHFANAWSQEGRSWSFPISAMRECAQSLIWNSELLGRIEAHTLTLPGQAALPWRKELSEREAQVRAWAMSLNADEPPAPVGAARPDAMALEVAEIERKLLGRRPEVRERISRSIERGVVGQRLKRANGFKCQICEAMGLNPIGFLKRDGEPYVEAHHATPVSELEIGSLAASNIMILCANHHRQMHYGEVALGRTRDEFILEIGQHTLRVKRFAIEG